MRDIYFEELIRQKLQNLEVPFNPEDWKEMEVMMDELSEIEDSSPKDQSKQEISPEDLLVSETLLTDFDKEILKKLETYQETPISTDWDLFSAKLDENLFDEAIKEKIAENQIPFEQGDWDLLASKLDDNPIDSVFRNTLATYQVPFYSPDWFLLSETLNKPFDLSIKEKLNGLSLRMPIKDWRVMSNLLDQTLIPYQHIPWYSNWKNHISYASILLLLLLSFWGIKEEQILTRGEREYVEYHAPVFNQEETQKNTPSKDIQTIHSELQELGKQKDQPNSISVSEKVINREDEEQIPTKRVFRSQLSFVDNLDSSIETQAVENILIPITSDQATEIKEKYRKIRIERNIASLSGISPDEDFKLISLKLNKRGIHKIEPQSKKRTPELRIGLFAGNTSSSLELSDPGEPGYTGGMRLEFMVNDEFSVLTGLNYSKKNMFYESQIFIRAGVKSDEFMQGSLETVELPLLFRYNFPTQNRLHLYAQGGVVTTISIKEDFEYLIPDNFNPSLFRAPDQGTDRKFNTYVGNLYAAAGFEYQLNSSLAIQIEPYFQVNMQKTKGILALEINKPIYTTGIGLGLFYNLNNKKKH